MKCFKAKKFLSVLAAVLAAAICLTAIGFDAQAASPSRSPADIAFIEADNMQVRVTFHMQIPNYYRIETRDVPRGTAVGELNMPSPGSRIGYQFMGWNTMPGGTGSTFIYRTPVEHNTEVFAQWRAVENGTEPPTEPPTEPETDPPTEPPTTPEPTTPTTPEPTTPPNWDDHYIEDLIEEGLTPDDFADAPSNPFHTAPFRELSLIDLIEMGFRREDFGDNPFSPFNTTTNPQTNDSRNAAWLYSTVASFVISSTWLGYLMARKKRVKV